HQRSASLAAALRALTGSASASADASASAPSVWPRAVSRASSASVRESLAIATNCYVRDRFDGRLSCCSGRGRNGQLQLIGSHQIQHFFRETRLMGVKVAINGFGRIGRNVLRAIYESGRTDIEVVAINDLGPVATNAHLLRFDSVHGRFPGEVKSGEDWIDIGRGKIKVTAVKNPAELPHKDLGVDIALECTGIFTARDKAALHLEGGAKRVIVSAPADGADYTVVYGVNHQGLTKDHVVISNASCTTNCLAPVVKVLHDAIGIDHGMTTTIHSYTGDQPTLDTLHKDRSEERRVGKER